MVASGEPNRTSLLQAHIFLKSCCKVTLETDSFLNKSLIQLTVLSDSSSRGADLRFE